MAALDKHDTYKEEIKDLSIAELKSKKRKKLAFPWKERVIDELIEEKEIENEIERKEAKISRLEGYREEDRIYKRNATWIAVGLLIANVAQLYL